jgi:hypothetical protein
MAELIWLFIVLLFGFACGYAARSSISRRRRDAERKRFRSHQMKEGGLSRPESSTVAAVRRLYQKSKAP